MSFFGLFSSAAGAAAEDAFTPEPPWKAKTVVAAGMATLAGTAGWISDIVSSGGTLRRKLYRRVFIGWAFRRFVMFVMVMGAVTIAGIALLKMPAGGRPIGQRSNGMSPTALTALQQGHTGQQFRPATCPRPAAAAGLFMGVPKEIIGRNRAGHTRPCRIVKIIARKLATYS